MQWKMHLCCLQKQSDEGISVDRMWHDHWIQMCIVAFLPSYPPCGGSIFQLLGASWINMLKSHLYSALQTVAKVPSLNLHPLSLFWNEMKKYDSFRWGTENRQWHVFVCIRVKLWRAELTMTAGLSENGLWLNLITRERLPPILPAGCVCVHNFEHSRWLSSKYVFPRWG